MPYPSPADTKGQHECLLAAFIVIIAAAIVCVFGIVCDAGVKSQELPHTSR